MTIIAPDRIQALITQDFDKAQAPGQLDGRSVQVGPAQGSRVQPSASGFINKVKSLYDRDIRLQRAEEGVTRGVKNLDKALGKLLDATKPDNKGSIDFAKVFRRLEALPGSAKSATSRGVTFDELIKARLEKMDDKTLREIHDVINKSVVNKFVLKHIVNDFTNKPTLSYFQRKHSNKLAELHRFFHNEIKARSLATPKVETDSGRQRAEFDNALVDLLGALTPDSENKISSDIGYYLRTFSASAKKMDSYGKLNHEFIKEQIGVYANNSSDDLLGKLKTGIKLAINDRNSRLDKLENNTVTACIDINVFNEHLNLLEDIEEVFFNKTLLNDAQVMNNFAVLDNKSGILDEAASQNTEPPPDGNPKNASKSFAYRTALGRLLDAMMPDDRRPIDHGAFDLRLKDLRAFVETSTKTDCEAFKKNFVNHVAGYSSDQLIKLEANTKAAIDRLNVQYDTKKDETLLPDLENLIWLRDDLSNELERRANSIPQVLDGLFKAVLSGNGDKESSEKLSKLCHDYHQALHALKQVRHERDNRASEIDDMTPLEESIKKYPLDTLSEISDQMEAVGSEWPQRRQYHRFERESEQMTLLNMATTIKRFLSSQDVGLLEISDHLKRPGPGNDTERAV